ncbi:MAG: GtrA family protein [Acidobacteria bacterium]|nr:GtrA family protein [Acidobacteriota bacterium]
MAVRLGARWLKFNAVGLIGIAVQLAALSFFARLLHWHYLIATAAAVEIAVLHNFVWHEVWTWRDRRGQSGTRMARLLRFHLGNGAVSLLANLIFMRIFAGAFHLPLMLANLISIALAALLNFAISEWWVFRSR